MNFNFERLLYFIRQTEKFIKIIAPRAHWSLSNDSKITEEISIFLQYSWLKYLNRIFLSQFRANIRRGGLVPIIMKTEFVNQTREDIFSNLDKNLVEFSLRIVIVEIMNTNKRRE